MALNTKLEGNILGIDLGTSGIRAVIVSLQNTLLHEIQVAMPFPKRDNNTSQQDITIWHTALDNLLTRLNEVADLSTVRHIVADATSSTVLLIDNKLAPLTPALMYDDSRATKQADQIKTYATTSTAAQGASSTLAKVMWLEGSRPFEEGQTVQYFICHQIDWLNSFFTQKIVPTDANNALKLGYDVINRCWPDWVKNCIKTSLPKVVMPGAAIDTIAAAIADKYHFHPETKIHAGTTDSIAAFLASGANQIGDATTSLGSTLSLKLLSDKPIFSPTHGIYSHILGDLWLIGGASNCGGAVLLKYFSLDQIITLLSEINIHKPTGLNYYPLITKGERFPIADSHLEPKVSPRPKLDSEFLHTLIEGLVSVEKLAYETLENLGATNVKQVYAVGGGTKNPIWMTLREQNLGYKTKKAAHIDAAFGVTQLLIKAL
ncbi:FGGY-family carbohydrate kinase [Hydrogenovibrio kuenenii]|uniref:FGGY-family carbohydrate kinase n=1 Tax=Hydrogenovibrio kuenenii TaxID=63658 RepID=UPI000463F2A1|nr:FGGY-family carbohydrate kinase [Hydrogenovibrio kuenenii]